MRGKPEPHYCPQIYSVLLWIYMVVALASGEWEILDRNLWVDKEKQLVYFIVLRETPLEKHLYVVSLQRPEHIRQLSDLILVEFDFLLKVVS